MYCGMLVLFNTKYLLKKYLNRKYIRDLFIRISIIYIYIIYKKFNKKNKMLQLK